MMKCTKKFKVNLTISLYRYSAACGNGELGGPLGTRYASSIFLGMLWLVYVLLSALETYGHITGF